MTRPPTRRSRAGSRSEWTFAVLGRPVVAVTVTSAGQLIAQLNRQIAELQAVVAEGLGRHPDADIVTSQPGLDRVLGARVLAEFGDDSQRSADAKARKNYAGTSTITRASGTCESLRAGPSPPLFVS